MAAIIYNTTTFVFRAIWIFLVASLIIIIPFILRHFFPIKEKHSDREIKRLKQKYERTKKVFNNLLGISIIVAFILFIPLYFFFFLPFFRSQIQNLFITNGLGNIVYFHQSMFILVPYVFFSIVFFGGLLFFILRLYLGKDKWNEYWIADSYTYIRGKSVGGDLLKANYIFMIIFLVLSVFGLVWGVDDYTAISEDGIHFNYIRDFGKEEFYNWNEIESINYVETYYGKISKKIEYDTNPYYYVVFKDGKQTPRMENPKEVEFISGKSNIEIKEFVRNIEE